MLPVVVIVVDGRWRWVRLQVSSLVYLRNTESERLCLRA